MHTACGVAHQALEEICPKGEDILIQGRTLNYSIPFNDQQISYLIYSGYSLDFHNIQGQRDLLIIEGDLLIIKGDLL